MKPIILSGIQPSGRLHIGNYLGALKHFVDLQNSGEYDCRFMIADLHSLTEPYQTEEKSAQVTDLAASFLAAGLNPKKSILFLQSQVSAHTQLAWILSTLTPMGELSRMTQYKDKSERMETNVGLFTYPVLQVADIILYNPEYVPVGDDQDQHLELARTLVRKFNGRFGETFTEPKSKHTATPRIMSLADPQKKMSKSQPSGCLFIDDEPEVVRKKIMGAVTDSGSEVKFDETNKPGVANLLRIASALSGKSVAELEKEFAGANYSTFKAAIAEIVVERFAAFREEKKKLMANPKKALGVFESGSKKANKIAAVKLKAVYEKIGLK